jgi:nicotinate-nucleotide adenylyltransferase
VARVGLLGGTFDPVHMGHLIMAECARDELGLDWIEFVPALTPPHKRDEPVIDVKHRVGMIEAAIAGNASFQINRIELDREGPSFTVETLALLRESRPDDTFVFIVGSDSLIDLPRWHQPQRILELTELAVIARPGSEPNLFEITQSLPNIATKYVDVRAPHIDISSTQLREMIHDQRSIRYQTPDPVIAYIERERLYRS